jgi:hypothetical protein
MEPRDGGCACGAIRYTIGATSDVGDCHCRTCRRSVGAAYVTWATVAPEALVIRGTPRWWASSPRAERGFCPDCGTSLFFRPRAGGFVDVTVASLDAPEGLPPRYAIWGADRLPWAPLDPTLPLHEEDGPDHVAE